MGKTEDKFTAMLRAVGDPVRRKILKLLAEEGQCSIERPVGMCGADVEARVGLSQPTVSHHMAVLTKAGLVTAQRSGHWMWYRRNEKGLKELRRLMREEL